MKIRNKILLQLVLPVAMCLAVMAIILKYVVVRSFVDSEVKKDFMVMEKVVDNIAEAMDFQNIALVERTVKAHLAHSDDVSYFYVTDPTGTIQSSFESKDLGRDISQFMSRSQLNETATWQKSLMLWMINEPIQFNLYSTTAPHDVVVDDVRKAVTGEAIFEVHAHVLREGRSIGTIVIGFNQRALATQMSYVRNVVFGVGAVVTLFMTLFVLILSSRLVNPISALARELNRVKVADLSGDLDSVALNDCLRSLTFAESMNNTLETDQLVKASIGFRDMLIGAIKRIETSSKLEATAKITQNIVHDLRSYLSDFERLLRLPGNVTIGSQREKIKESLFRLSAMVDALRRNELETVVRPERQRLDFERGLERLSFKAKDKGINLVFPAEIGFTVIVDPLKFERAWMNLVGNAIDAAHEEVRLELNRYGRDLTLRVLDNGPGVPGGLASKLFERGATFAKTDGTGLGLAYVRQIMRGHGGDVQYRREGGWTIFECWLPGAVLEDQERSVPDLAPSIDKQASREGRSVAFCMKPTELNEKIKLAFEPLLNGYDIHGDYFPDASHVITNQCDIVALCIENGNKLIQFKVDIAENDIIRRLKSRLDIHA